MVWVPILEEGVFRFDASEDARAAAGPSLSFAEPRRREVQRQGGDFPAVLPACEVAGNVQKVVIKVRVIRADALVF
jgi:alpha-glucosidase